MLIKRIKTVQEAMNQTCTQAEFGQIVGISQSAVSGLMSKGVLLQGQTAQEWLNRYLTHLHSVIIDRHIGR